MVRLLSITLLVLAFYKTSAQETILWSVKASNGKMSYLLGTYHYIGNSFIDSLSKIRSSLLSCQAAIFESTDVGPKIAAFLNSRTDDLKYREQLKPEDIKTLDQLEQNWAVPVRKLTPSLLLLKLQQTYFETQCGTVKSTDSWKHFDNYLLHIADSNGLELVGLETDTLMFQHLQTMPGTSNWKDAQKEIHNWLENITKQKNRKQHCKNAYDYLRFDFNYQFSEPCGNNVLLSQRNKNWLTQLPPLLDNKSCFVTVGLLHLYGECGLISQLRKRGYIVEPVYNLAQ